MFACVCECACSCACASTDTCAIYACVWLGLCAVCCVLCPVCGVWCVVCAVCCVQLCNRPYAVEGCMNSAVPHRSQHAHSAALHSTLQHCAAVCCVLCAVCCVLYDVGCVLCSIDTHSSFCSSTQLPTASCKPMSDDVLCRMCSAIFSIRTQSFNMVNNHLTLG